MLRGYGPRGPGLTSRPGHPSVILPSAFVRGDANGDGTIDLGDAIYLLNYLFKNDDPPDPLEAGDANCDDIVNVNDAIYILNYLFRGGDPPGCP